MRTQHHPVIAIVVHVHHEQFRLLYVHVFMQVFVEKLSVISVLQDLVGIGMLHKQIQHGLVHIVEEFVQKVHHNVISMNVLIVVV